MQLNNRPTHEMAIVLLGTAGAAFVIKTNTHATSARVISLRVYRSLRRASHTYDAHAETDNPVNTEMAKGGDEGQVTMPFIRPTLSR